MQLLDEQAAMELKGNDGENRRTFAELVHPVEQMLEVVAACLS